MIAPFFFLSSILEEESKDIFLQDVKFDMVFVKFAKPGYFCIITFRSLMPDGRGMIRRRWKYDHDRNMR